VITFIGPRGANGNLVSISHEGGYESHYAHLSRFASGLVRGATVRQRQVIGYVGSTGRSTGPHLHFGLERNGAFVDPARELNGPGRVLPGGQLARFRAQLPALRAALDAIVIPEVAVVAPAADEERPAAVEGAMD
jgi:murein DD-endopeptidase MepM/ murein hydrolase activator NlpD